MFVLNVMAPVVAALLRIIIPDFEIGFVDPAHNTLSIQSLLVFILFYSMLSELNYKKNYSYG